MISTRDKLLAELQRAPGGAGTETLALALGITVTAVRQHLVSLERDGLVAKGASLPSGGRPQQLYVLTTQAQETFPRQYSWFSEILLDALGDDVGKDKLKKKLRVLGQKVGASVASRGNARERAAALASKMKELGYDARVVDEHGKLEVAARNCVFHQLAAKHDEVCSFDLGLIETVADADVDHEECIVKGGAECRFRLKRHR